MKVEKINENKIRITLTLEELSKRKISIKDIEKNSVLARELFVNLIEEYNLEEDFPLDGSQFFIEARSDSSNLFIVTITKIENMPEVETYDLPKKAKIKKENKKDLNNLKQHLNYTIDSFVYMFDSLETILEMCDKTKKEKLFFGKNSLYKNENNYFLIFSKSSVKNKKFIKTFVFLSEYCSTYYSYDIFGISIKEKSKIIIENNALQKLVKI